MISTTKIAIVGASGRMGRALIAAVHENKEAELVGTLERESADTLGSDSGELAAIGKNNIRITADRDMAFRQAEVIIDFTTPASTLEFAEYASDNAIAHVIGTTGMSADDEMRIRQLSHKVPIMKSGNMSMGVIMLSALVERAAKILPAADWDIEVLEMHHKHKVDAPSGTAFLLGQAAADGRDIELADKAIRVRDGHTGPREDGTIGFATMRGGSVIGDHSVMFAGNGESITLSHRAEDRSIFARGAIKAAIWTAKQEPGLYSMRDVLGVSN